jgi:hypothetical protein
MKVATLIARALDAKSVLPAPRIYNESRSFGDSMKVQGWTPAQYERCANILISMGYMVRIVRTPRVTYRYGWKSGGHLRLWVYA